MRASKPVIAAVVLTACCMPMLQAAELQSDTLNAWNPRLAEDRKLRIERDQKLLDEQSDLVFVAFESFCHGNGYVGSKAAQDDRWVESVYQDLCQKWPRAAGPSKAVLEPLPDGL